MEEGDGGLWHQKAEWIRTWSSHSANPPSLRDVSILFHMNSFSDFSPSIQIPQSELSKIAMISGTQRLKKPFTIDPYVLTTQVLFLHLFINTEVDRFQGWHKRKARQNQILTVEHLPKISSSFCLCTTYLCLCVIQKYPILNYGFCFPQ